MLIETKKLSPGALYHALIQTVIPRPIGWALTDNGTGEGASRYNLAPFSFFNAVSADPPLLMLSIQQRDGQDKDTYINIIERKLATVHISGRKNLEHMVDSSVDLPHGESELLRKPYELKEEIPASLPRLKEAPIAFFCKLHSTYKPAETSPDLVFLEIEHIYIVEGCIEGDESRLVINPLKIQPVSRLGGSFYSILNNIIAQQRPKI